MPVLSVVRRINRNTKKQNHTTQYSHRDRTASIVDRKHGKKLVLQLSTAQGTGNMITVVQWNGVLSGGPGIPEHISSNPA